VRRRRSINVKVIWRRDRKTYVLRWVDPQTGKLRQRTAGKRKRDAQRAAGRLAAEIEAGLVEENVPWDSLWNQYREEVFPLLRSKSRQAREGAVRRFISFARPRYLSDCNVSLLAKYVAHLRKSGLSQISIRSYIRELKTVLHWAAELHPKYHVPTIRLPRAPKGKRDRVPTTEEFERMLDKTSEVVGQRFARSWQFFLLGLWHSGLRLSEALSLWWDKEDGWHLVELDGERPLLAIPAESEKGNTYRLYPLTPQFVDLLRSVRPERRFGKVFRPTLGRGTVTLETASATVAKIGKAANVVVGIVNSGKRKGQPKYASAHDLRAAFGQRLAMAGIPPFYVKELMRHRSVQTTEKYYLRLNARKVADLLWAALGSQVNVRKGDQMGDQTESGLLSRSHKPRFSKSLSELGNRDSNPD